MTFAVEKKSFITVEKRKMVERKNNFPSGYKAIGKYIVFSTEQ